jgi:uncharacterized repeat protein (TIGR02543 family)
MRKYVVWFIVTMLIVQIGLPGADRASASSGSTYVLVDEVGNGNNFVSGDENKTKAKEIGIYGEVYDMVIDESGNLYFTIMASHVYKVTPAGDLSVFAGIGKYRTETYPFTPEQENRVVDKRADEVRFPGARALAIDSDNNMYIAERSSGKVIKVNLLSNKILAIYDVTLQGANVRDIALDSSGNLYIYSFDTNQSGFPQTYYLDKLDVTTGTFTSITDIELPVDPSGALFGHIAVDSQGDLYFSRPGQNSAIFKYSISDSEPELTTFASRSSVSGGIDFQHPRSMAFDADDNLYFTTAADSANSNYGNQIIRVTQTGTKSLIAGNEDMLYGNSPEGTEAINAFLGGTRQIAIHPVNGTIYFEEYGNRVIRSIRPVYNIEYRGSEHSGGELPDNQQVYENKPATIALQGNLVKEGHTFVKWNTAADGSGADYAAGATITPTEDLTLYAIWEPEKFNLIYNVGANGTLTSGALANQTEIRHDDVPYNTTADPVTAVPNTGYAFTEWSDGEEAATRQDTATASLTVTANFLKQHTVTFDTYGGTPIAPQIVLDGRLLTLSTMPTNGDLALDGWYTDAERTLPFDMAATPITSDLTLYASWATKHMVSFHPHNGMPVGNISVTEATYMSPIADPVRIGYTFQGWYTDDGTFTQLFDFANTPIMASFSLYAKWGLTPPGAPTIVSTTPSNAKVELVWDGVPFATGYNVYQSTTSGTTGTLVATVTDSVYRYEATGLTNGTTYYFVVGAVNEIGENRSVQVSATPVTVPGAPTGVNAVAFNGQATITFTAPADNGGSAITGYRVTSTPGNIVVTTSNDDTTVEVTGLTNGTPYTFTVEALNAVGYGTASAASEAVTPKAVASAPTGVTAVAGNGQATITFTAPADNGGSAITGYRVTSTPGDIVKTTDNDATTVVVTGLTNGMSYTFTVEALNAAGYGVVSTASEPVTPKTVPDAPTGVTAVAGNGEVTITFTAPSDNGGSAISGYRVTSTPGNIVKTTDTDATTVVVTGLTNGTSYTFTVEALNAAGYGSASSASEAVTPKTVPDAPTGVTAVAGNGQATITFTAPADNGGSAITGYQVTSTPGNIVKTTDNDATTVVVTGLTNGTTYTFTVEALNAAGASSASEASEAVTPMTVAGAPTGVTAVAGNGQVTITFTAPADNGGSAITGYRVTSTPGNMVKTTDTDATTVVVTGLTNGTSYTFTVEALNAAGASSASEASEAVTPKTVPDAPTGVTAVAGNGEVTITFAAPADNGGSAITGYRVTSTPGNMVKTTDTDATIVVVTGLTNGTSYTFTVEALNSVGYGAASAASGSVTAMTVAGAPTGVAAVAGNEQATITFTAPADNGGSAITGYRVTSTPGNIVETTTNDATSIVVTGLTNGTTYTFTVEALNAAGASAASTASEAVTPMTVAGAPTGVTAVAGNGEVTITFTAPSDNGGSAITGYRVTSTPGNIVKTTDNDATTVVVTGLTNGTSYTFIVEAVNAVGTGAASAASEAVTPKAVASVPTEVTAVAGNGQATITFTAPADNGGSAITGYRVTSTPGNIVVETTNDSTTVSVAGLTNGTSYTFTVEALNAAGYGVVSAASEAVTPMTVAGAPTEVTAVAGNEQATITFTAPTDNGGSTIIGYRVTSLPDNIVVTTTNDDTTVAVTGLTNGTSYTFTVETLNSVGYGAASAASGSVTPMTVAGAPTGVTAVAGNGQATITFTAPSDNGGGAITGYRVTSTPGNIVVTTTNADSSVVVTGLTNGTSYTFTVEALNAAGNGAASVASEAVTPTAPPSGGGSGGGGAPNAEPVVSTDGEITLPVGTAGEVQLGETITITIPAGASEQELKLTVEQVVDSAGLAGAGEVFASPVFELLKNFSDNFAEPVVLAFKFDASKVQEGQRAAIFYYDEDSKTWVEVGGTVNGDTISVEVDHFTKFAVLIVGQQQQPQEQALSLTDIGGHWAADKITEAVQQGIVSGYQDGTFKPNALITRAEFSVMLAKALKLDGQGAPLGFIDAKNIGAWAKVSVAQAAEAGIISGYSDNSFRPGANITRTELAVMIARAYSTEAATAGSSGFTDESEIPDWARGAVSLVKELGIVSGKNGNKFAPQDTATRAEAVTMIINLLQVKK